MCFVRVSDFGLCSTVFHSTHLPTVGAEHQWTVSTLKCSCHTPASSQTGSDIGDGWNSQNSDYCRKVSVKFQFGWFCFNQGVKFKEGLKWTNEKLRNGMKVNCRNGKNRRESNRRKEKINGKRNIRKMEERRKLSEKRRKNRRKWDEWWRTWDHEMRVNMWRRRRGKKRRKRMRPQQRDIDQQALGCLQPLWCV